MTGAKIGRVRCSRVTDGGVIGLEFVDGSVGTVNLTSGHRSVAKERLRSSAAAVFSSLDNFRKLRVHGGGGSQRLWRQDKGQWALVRAFVESVRDASRPDVIAIEELLEVSRVTIEAACG